MFDQPDDPDLTPRSCWRESALLISLLQSLPNLEHLSFFADQSDDSTLVLAFATLIPHPSLHPTPPPTQNPSRRENTISGRSSPSILINPSSPLPLTSRIRSFGWRQRSKPPLGYEDFSTASTFVSTFHLIRHAHRLEYLVLDADMDKIRSLDITILLAELRRRKAPTGEALRPCALTLCGPIKEWAQDAKGVLEALVRESGGHVGELFLDRPLAKSTERHIVDPEVFVSHPKSHEYIHPDEVARHPITIAGASASSPATSGIILFLKRGSSQPRAADGSHVALSTSSGSERGRQ